MKAKLLALLIFMLTIQNYFPQGKEYWKNAPANGDKIYSLKCLSETDIYAISADSEIFISTNKGEHWRFVPKSQFNNSIISNPIWSAEILCSVMKSVDGGKIWQPYSDKKQDHFCKVYFKDPNVNYKTAEEFLSRVTVEIIESINKNEIETLQNNPKQCTEYYTNEKEGWALGWCVKNFVFAEK